MERSIALGGTLVQRRCETKRDASPFSTPSSSRVASARLAVRRIEELVENLGVLLDVALLQAETVARREASRRLRRPCRRLRQGTPRVVATARVHPKTDSDAGVGS